MIIEHAALYTDDLERMKDFYMHYFGGVLTRPLYHNQKTGFKSYFLSFGGGSRLELMTRDKLAAPLEGEFIRGYSHIAFSAGSRDSVDSVTERFKSDDFKVVSGPRETGDGCFESCILDPDGNPVEITV